MVLRSSTRARHLAAALGLSVAVPSFSTAQDLGPRSGVVTPGSSLPVGDETLGVTDDMPDYGANLGLISGPSISPERARVLESEVMRRIEQIRDPLERSQALDRLALTKLRLRDLDAAHRVALRAAEAVSEGTAGLERDLRLMNLIDLLLDVANAQVIEGLSSVPFSLSNTSGLPPALDEEGRVRRLGLAREEWRLAYAIARKIENANYRPEKLNDVAISQSGGSQLIARSGLRGSLVPLVPDVPRSELLRIADEMLVEAAAEANAIERDVWRNRAVVSVVSNAAESAQFGRALLLSQALPDPGTRAEGLIQTAGLLLRQGSRVEAEFPRLIDESWMRLIDTIGRAKASLASDSGGPIGASSLAFQSKRTQMEELIQAATALQQRAELLIQIVQNGRAGREGTSGHPIQQVDKLAAQLDATLPRLEALKEGWKQQLREAGAAIESASSGPEAGAGEEPADPFIAIAKGLPSPDDPSLVDLGAQIAMLSDEAVRTARVAMIPEATVAYNQAAQAIAEIPSDDPRAESARILVESLIGVQRFHDARAAVRLLPRQELQLLALGKIAEAQGRLGLIESAFAWIEGEIRPEFRDELYQLVEQGALNSIDESRMRRALSIGNP